MIYARKSRGVWKLAVMCAISGYNYKSSARKEDFKHLLYEEDRFARRGEIILDTKCMARRLVGMNGQHMM